MHRHASAALVAALLVVPIACGAMLSPPATVAMRPGDPAATVLWAEAMDRILSGVLNGTPGNRWVYGNPAMVTPGTVVETWYGPVTLPPAEGWVAFVDDAPAANWAHPCRYVFVDRAGRVTVVDALGPPPDLDAWPRIAPADPGRAQALEGSHSFRCLAAGERVFCWYRQGDAIILLTFDRASGSLVSRDEWGSTGGRTATTAPTTAPATSGSPSPAPTPGFPVATAASALLGAAALGGRRRQKPGNERA